MTSSFLSGSQWWVQRTILLPVVPLQHWFWDLDLLCSGYFAMPWQWWTLPGCCWDKLFITGLQRILWVFKGWFLNSFPLRRVLMWHFKQTGAVLVVMVHISQFRMKLPLQDLLCFSPNPKSCSHSFHVFSHEWTGADNHADLRADKNILLWEEGRCVPWSWIHTFLLPTEF